MIQITNEEFLRHVFRDDYIWAHCTSFPDDPADISDKRRAKCWGGGWFHNTPLIETNNNYFTISTFYADGENNARRRKNLFRCTHVIVADDVREKLPVEQVQLLPEPSYKLATSPGSEQWGWVLDTPCQDMAEVENLLDGLVAKGLSPSGKDPGMRGVTRYVRLPVGRNSKASRVAANGGTPPACQLLEWHPERVFTMEQLAQVFTIDLASPRRETRVDGAAQVDDHPLLQLPDLIHVKEVRSPGRYDVTCPWVENHTGAADDGAAIFTNTDGSIGLKCHHGCCQDKTGKDLLDYVERSVPGFKQQLRAWQTLRSFTQITGKVTPVSFLDMSTPPGEPEASPVSGKRTGDSDDLIETAISTIFSIAPGSNDSIEGLYALVDMLEVVDMGRRLNYYSRIREHYSLSKSDLQRVIDERRRHRREQKASGDMDFYKAEVYVGEQDQFYNAMLNIWRKPAAFQNNYCHLDPDAKLNALQNGRCLKVDRIDFAPGLPPTWIDEYGCNIVNTWVGVRTPQPEAGDATPWFDHFDRLGWSGELKKHVLQWMAYTLRYPERKINHILLLAGGEGCGKDFLLTPLLRYFGRYGRVMNGAELLSGFNEYIMNTKCLIVNESEHGDHNDASAIYNKLKTMAATPPVTLALNAKNRNRVEVRNILNMAMTSNSVVPIQVSEDTRRLYPLWTNVSQAGLGGRAYWTPLWDWLNGVGWQYCCNYLINHVDLSDFDPGAAPPVTDFLIEMRQQSEHPAVTKLKQLIDDHTGVFSCDLVSMTDIVNMMRAGYSEKLPSENKIGRLIAQNNLAEKRTSKYMDNGRQRDLTIYIIRNREHYATMTQTPLHHEYVRQRSVIASNTVLTAVK
jgi:hypothetical protein